MPGVPTECVMNLLAAGRPGRKDCGIGRRLTQWIKFRRRKYPHGHVVMIGGKAKSAGHAAASGGQHAVIP